MRRLVTALIIAVGLLPLNGAAQPASKQGPVITWTLGGAEPCPASAALCAAWLEFRRSHPWPYQTLAVDLQGAPGHAVVVLSEPPPSVRPAELEQLVANVFGSSLVEIVRLRWPTGIDGWLEDLVLRVGLPQKAVSVPVMQGQDFDRVMLPDWLVDRLGFVHQVLHHTRDGFYVDVVGAGGAPDQRRGIGNIEINPSDVQGWLGSDTARWRPLDRAGGPEVTWKAVREVRKPGAFARADGHLVALVIPKGVPLAALAVPFRQFAITSDLLVAAVQRDQSRASEGPESGARAPKPAGGSPAAAKTAAPEPRGGVILLGRLRQLPFATVPPLRYETFAWLVANRATELHQSYERQRLFAGKVMAGPHTGWDWAPIALSAQLEDGELGTLLNLADQILKSWSERGTVDYLAFDYRTPGEFPFQALPASGFFRRQLGTTSLVFNWNTHGHGALTRLKFGTVLTGARSGALPVLYIPSGGLAEATQGAGSRAPGLDLIRQERQRVARDAADSAYDYFVGVGDPILVRTVQNVFLYQAITAFLDLPRAPEWEVSPSHSRADAVAQTLRTHASQWLKRVTTPGATELEVRTLAAVNRVLQRPGMTVTRLAEVLATPQAVVQKLVREETAVRALQGKGADAWAASQATEQVYKEAFERYCAEVLARGGKRETIGDTTHCKMEYTGALPSAVSATAARLQTARAAHEEATALLEGVWKELESSIERLRSLDADIAAAEALGRDPAIAEAVEQDRDDVLAAILTATQASGPGRSIRTPSVVLSRNQERMWSVGGHNIDSKAVRVVPSDTAKIPARTVRDGVPALLVPRSDLDRANVYALATERGQTLEAAAAGSPPKPPRSIEVALGVPDEAPRPRAETLLQAWREVPAVEKAPILKRAEACECIVYVERVDGDLYEVVRTQPRPPHQQTIVGGSQLAETLAGLPASGTMQYAGFTAANVSSLIDSVQLARARTASVAPVRVRSWLDSARELFGALHEPTTDTVRVHASPAGHQTLRIRAAKEVDIAAVLSSRPTWKAAKIETEASPGDWLARAGVPRRPDEQTTPAVVTVRFGKSGSLESLSVAGEFTPTATTDVGARLKASIAPSVEMFTKNNANLDAAILTLRQRITQALKPRDLTFFINSNLGDVQVVRVRDGAITALAAR